MGLDEYNGLTPESRVFLAKDGFIAILKQMTITAMPAIEVDRVSGQKPPHDCCDRDRSGP